VHQHDPICRRCNLIVVVNVRVVIFQRESILVIENNRIENQLSRLRKGFTTLADYGVS
jgi:hypothetical protein